MLKIRYELMRGVSTYTLKPQYVVVFSFMRPLYIVCVYEVCTKLIYFFGALSFTLIILYPSGSPLGAVLKHIGHGMFINLAISTSLSLPFNSTSQLCPHLNLPLYTIILKLLFIIMVIIIFMREKSK